MKKILLLLFIIRVFGSYGQTLLKTYYGEKMYPVDTFRALNVFININYDSCPTCDPCYGKTTTNWMPGSPNTINDNPPGYLNDYMDSDFNPNNIHGTFTKRYAEASFNKFIVLGDHIVVNIKQSNIEPSGGNFTLTELIDSCISLINQKGGLQTKNEHDSISDYDGTYLQYGYKFKVKPQNYYNDRIDFMQVYIRNCTKDYGGLKNGGFASFTMNTKLLIKGKQYSKDAGTVQGAIKNRDLSNPQITEVDIHEMAHNLLGMTNSAHMGGGGPLNSGNLITLEANCGGWSLIGSAPSSLISCNGFERWRLNWLGPLNNNYPIAASNEDSYVDKSEGNHQTFYLRDFITFGDVVKIKLPYKDADALDQYIWLENHQIHNNGKEDYPAYWTYDCKDDGVPGIYAYYQVGKNIRESYDLAGLYEIFLLKDTNYLQIKRLSFQKHAP